MLLLLLLPLLVSPAAKAGDPHVEAAALAAHAYADTVGRFWIGTSKQGHLQDQNPAYHHPASLWEVAQGVNVLWGYWKLTGSADAASRIAAWWAWAEASRFGRDFAGCGHESVNNFAQDDLAWNVGAYLRVYDATRNPHALAAARAALDCADRRWWDTGFAGGGYWYADDRKNKSSYQAVLMLDCVWYYQITGDRRYLQRAVDGEAWLAGHMLRDGNGAGNPDDGLYWCDLWVATGTWGGITAPDQIEEGSSNTGLYANTSAALLDARLYAILGTPAYLARLRRTASGIRRLEVQHLPDGDILLNDRDASDDAFSIVPFAAEVLPRLAAPERAAWVALLGRTARRIMAQDRAADGSYGASWAGPPDGHYAELTGGKVIRQDLRVSAQAAAIVIAAAAAN
jgi:hypothetical protein